MGGQMRSNNLVILAVAVLLGGIAAVLARNWLANHARATQSNVGTIVVASTPLVFGTQLAADNTTEIPWSTEVLPEGAFATKDDLLKSGRRIALALIARNEPVLSSKITAPNQPATLSSMLDPGKRAVTVRVDDVRGVAGFIEPGDLVDVVLIRTEAEMRRSDSYSDVILQSAKVLAIDQVTGERTDKPTIAKAVTLEVSPEDAQKILLATNIGHLSLILRQPAEKAAEAARRVTERDLGDPPVPPPPPAPPPQPLQVITRPPVQAPAPVVAPTPVVRTKRITIFHGLKEQDYNLPVEHANPPVERGLMTQESN
jgi:pilus assembly protein CpaB